MTALLAIARRHGLAVVEDAAHALPTTCAGARRHARLRRDRIQLLREQDDHDGEGGMVVHARRALAGASAAMRLHGMSRDAFDRFTAKVPSWYYEVVAPGFKYNLTDIAAALGLQQLKRARAFQQRRSDDRGRLPRGAAGPAARPAARSGRGRSARVAPLRRALDRRRADRPRRVHRAPVRAAIGCSVHYIPLHLQPYWRDRYGLRPAQFPHSQHATSGWSACRSTRA
jgi:dTDP-4-amino-4,6-dideoxygalactose transaminase